MSYNITYKTLNQHFKCIQYTM